MHGIRAAARGMPSVVGRARAMLRAEGVTGFARRLNRWLTERRQSLVLAQRGRGWPRLTTRYRVWLDARALTHSQLERQRAACAELAYQPLVSVMTPVFNPPPAVLRAAIESVLAQTYPRWELCLADGGSERPGVREVLDEYARRDPRIRLTRLARNLGISGNSNEAARLATGDYLLIFDHDDLLAPNALFEIASALNAQPATDLVYYDEDMLSADGRRHFHPIFKPDWSPELLLSVNYLMHCTIRRELFWALGGFDAAYDGTQDWDLALKCAERTARIVHVPRVLYHWRAVPGSAATDRTAKPYVFERQLQCIAAHLQRQGLAEASATFAHTGFVRVRWPIRGSKVALIVPIPSSHERGARAALRALARVTAYPDYEIILVPMRHRGRAALTALTNDARTATGARPPVRLIEGGARSYWEACNLGARHATGELLLFLQPGVVPRDSDWLEELVRWAERPQIGAVGAKLLSAGGRVRHAGMVLGLRGAAGHLFAGVREEQGGPFGNVDWYRNYTAVTGSCLLLRREVFARLGGFDERFHSALGAVDLCLRLVDAGYRTVYTPYARLRARRGDASGARATAPMAADSALAHERLASRIQAGDPYFNPNLSLADAIPTIALYNGARRDGARRDAPHLDASHAQEAQDAPYARLSMGSDDARG